MGKKNIIKNISGKYKWRIAGLIVLLYLYPFYCLFINKVTGLNLGKLYTFDLPLKDFITVWIALGGIIGVVVNLFLAQKRITQQEKQLRDTRFSSGVELLGNPNESARIGGAYNLYFLANEYPAEYLDTVCEILCAHIRTITGSRDYQEKYKEKPSNEIQTILDLLCKKGKGGFIFSDCEKNLTTTFLSGTELIEADLSGAILSEAILFEADLSGAKLIRADLSEAKLYRADLSWANLFGAKLIWANLSEANLSGAILSGTILKDINFRHATLKLIDFSNTKKFELIDFSHAILEDVDFTGTVLEGYSYEEITRGGRSLELTKPKEEGT